jgi:hypothetical protein
MAAWLGFGGKSPPGPISSGDRTFKRYDGIEIKMNGNPLVSSFLSKRTFAYTF